MFLSHLRHPIALAVTLAAALAGAVSPALAAKPTVEDAQQLLTTVPLYFEENRGQLDDRVRFLSRSPEHTLFLTGNEAVLSLGSGTLRMSLVGGNPAPEVQALERQSSKSAYFTGSPAQWRTGVAHFAKVRYQEVYPGIDLVYYGKGQKLEHDFVVGPGADPSRIELRFDGTERIEITGDGDLALTVAGTQMRFSAPYAYLESTDGRVEVAARFVRTQGDRIGFTVEEYDRTKTLVIDPVLSYSTYFGGSQMDVATVVGVMSNGHILIGGITASTDFPTSGDGLQDVGGGAINVFLTQFDPFAATGGGLVYSSFFGGVKDEELTAMVLDATDNIYLTGTTLSGDFPVTGNAFQSERPAINETAFLTKFNLSADPKMLYGTYLGGDEVDRGLGIAIDGQGRAYLTGFTDSSDFPLSGAGLQQSGRGGGDAYFTIIDTIGGGMVYSTYLGGTSTDYANDVVLADDGTAFVVGFTASFDFPVKNNPYQGSAQGRGDAFLTQIDWLQNGLDGLGYSTYLGGSNLDEAQAIVRDPSGVLHLVGYTLSQDYPTTAAAVQPANAGNADIFVTTLDITKPGGEGLLFSTYLGGADGDVPYQMAMDSTGALVLAGYTLSPDLPITGDYYQNTNNGLIDAFFARLDPSKPAGQVFLCSSYFGGALSEIPWAMAVDNLDNIYLAGQTQSTDFPVTGNAFQGSKPGVVSAFVSKLGPCAAGDGAADDTTANRSPNRVGAGRASRGGGRGR